MFKILRDRNKEEPKHRIMNNIKNLPIYIIGNMNSIQPSIKFNKKSKMNK